MATLRRHRGPDRTGGNLSSRHEERFPLPTEIGGLDRTGRAQAVGYGGTLDLEPQPILSAGVNQRRHGLLALGPRTDRRSASPLEKTRTRAPQRRRKQTHSTASQHGKTAEHRPTSTLYRLRQAMPTALCVRVALFRLRVWLQRNLFRIRRERDRPKSCDQWEFTIVIGARPTPAQPVGERHRCDRLPDPRGGRGMR